MSYLLDSARHKKYYNWNHVNAYYDRSEVLQDPFKTEKSLTLRHSTDNLLTSVRINTWQRERNRSQVVRKDVLDNSEVQLPRISSATVFTNNFIHQTSWKQRILQIAENEELWRAAFDEYAITPTYDISSTGGYYFIPPSTTTSTTSTAPETSPSQSKYIRRNDVKYILKRCIGEDVPEFVYDKFKVLSQEKSIERLISWDDFRDILKQAVASIEAELDKKTETPGLIKLMMRPRLIDEDMGPSGEITTMYRDTISYTASNLFKSKSESESSDKFARTHPKSAADYLISSIPMDPSTAVLSAGTHTGTLRPSGYTGHIPANKRNAKKVEHSFGLLPRPSENNLMLSSRHIGCMSGYTGYVSTNAPEYKERTTACDPLTSNGAAYGSIRRIL